MIKINFQHIWVIGCPRSGTTFLTDYFGKYTDLIYNEPWKTHPLEKVDAWNFPPYKTLVFKYCCNWKRGNVILNKFPSSCFVYIIRNPDDIVNSWMFPKTDSYPLRPFDEFGEAESKVRFKNIIEQWSICTKGCLNFIDKHPKISIMVSYESIQNEIDRLAEFTKLPLKKEDLIFHNRNIKEAKAKTEGLWLQFPHILKYKQLIINKFYTKKILVL